MTSTEIQSQMAALLARLEAVLKRMPSFARMCTAPMASDIARTTDVLVAIGQTGVDVELSLYAATTPMVATLRILEARYPA